MDTTVEMLWSAGLGLFFLLIVVDSWRFGRPSTRRWRGVPVWRSRVAPELVEPLRYLDDTLDADWGWARRDGHLLVLHANPRVMPRDAKSFKTSWALVAVVNLRKGTITYQRPLGTSLFALPQVILFFPFIGLYAWNTHRQMRAVRAVLTELGEEAILRAASPVQVPGSKTKCTGKRGTNQRIRRVYGSDLRNGW